MAGLTGKTKEVSNVTPEAQAILGQLMSMFGGMDLSQGLFPTTATPAASELKPYTDMFASNNAYGLAQTKEAAGNLTGSSYGNQLGNKMKEQGLAENSFLAGLFEQRRTQDANRFASTLLGGLGSPAAGVQQAYQPGFLDYLTSAAGAAAPAFAGAFGKKA